MPTNQPCPLCSSPTRTLRSEVSGYREGTTFSILGCPNCDTHFSFPLETDAALYEGIYASAGTLPGYDRYALYAERVKQSDVPLALLAAHEDMYWFIFSYLEKRQASSDLNILEVGSGLGYLTYAISNQGYQVRGLDISEESVRRAAETYGPLFFQGDLFAYSEEAAGEYDIVIMTEVIEHVPDPVAFVNAAKRLLKPGGNLLLTTPNKSASPLAADWGGDGPPVHLWWFSESSLRQIAIATGLTLHLWDFAGFNSKRVAGASAGTRNAPHHFAPVLDSSSKPLPAVVARVSRRGVKRRVAQLMRRLAGPQATLGMKHTLQRLTGRQEFMRKRAHLMLSRSDSMGVVLTKP